MKSIIRTLFLVFVLGMINNITAQSSNSKKNILIQSNNIGISKSELTSAGEILKTRLINIGVTEVDLKLIPDKGQISLNITNKSDKDVLEYLLTHKGSIEFYETYNKLMLTKLFGGNKTLIDFLNSNSSGIETSVEIGCPDQDKCAGIIQMLNKSCENINCNFISAYLNLNSRKCFYAVKCISTNSMALNGSDIENIEFSNEHRNLQFQIEMKFKGNAKAKWAELNDKNIDKPIAVSVDNEVFFVPVLKSKIEGNTCMITGDFPPQQLQLFKAIGNSGALPTGFQIIK